MFSVEVKITWYLLLASKLSLIQNCLNVSKPNMYSNKEKKNSSSVFVLIKILDCTVFTMIPRSRLI